MNTYFRTFSIFVTVLLFFSLTSSLSFSQNSSSNDSDDSRRLWNEGLLQQRPTNKLSKQQPRSYVYTRAKVGSKGIKQVSANRTTVGLTLWRLRPVTRLDLASVSSERILVPLSDGDKEKGEYIPERINVGTPLQKGALVRMAIEVPWNAYLYVVDQESYSDGSLSAPYLIFPTTEIYSGNNSVLPGRQVEIPAQDTPPFILKPLAANKLEYSGEKLTFIISPKPLEGVEIGSSAKRLSQDLFLQWQKDWQVSTEQFSMKGGAGKGYTREEKTAGSNPKLIFTQDDPMPQNLFRIGKSTIEPVLFSIVIPTEAK